MIFEVICKEPEVAVKYRVRIPLCVLSIPIQENRFHSIRFTLTNRFVDSIRQFDKTDACTLIVT